MAYDAGAVIPAVFTILRCGLLPFGKESVLFFSRRATTVVFLSALAGACGTTAQPPVSPFVLDDFGDTIHTARPARRIVSLSPVTTELFFALGAGSRLVGRTHYDSYPAAALAVPDLGDGMLPNVEAILGVHPDLVVIYASQSNRAAAVQLRRAGVNTLAIRDDHISDFGGPSRSSRARSAIRSPAWRSPIPSSAPSRQ